MTGQGHKRTAIVTGASSGMGREFARQLDDKGLDEVWLVARRRGRLEEVAAGMSTPCRVVPADLAAAEGMGAVASLLEKERPSVAYLVEAAGLGKLGTWDTIPVADDDAMVDVNCKAVVHLATLVLPYMPRGSHLLVLDSCSAFTPLPHMGVYAATKAFVQSYVRSLRWEVRGRGVCATAVCPGWVRTEFMDVAERTGHDVRHYIGAQRPETVVRRALLANRLHFAVATCGVGAFVLRVLGKFVPHCVTMAGWAGVRRL